MSTPDIKGSCACGSVKFTLSEPPTMMGTCHCSRCRKAGAPSFVFVGREHFHLVSGRESISSWKALPPYKYDRCFCSNCGTALGEILSTGDSFPVNAHCLDTVTNLQNRFHEFVSEKPDWYEICDDARQFAEHPTKA